MVNDVTCPGIAVPGLTDPSGVYDEPLSAKRNWDANGDVYKLHTLLTLTADERDVGVSNQAVGSCKVIEASLGYV